MNSADHQPSTLPRIPYLRLRVRLRAARAAVLPPYKGSLLRGAFGHALRRSVCAAGRGVSCERCALRFACLYPRLFEPFVDGGPKPFADGLPAAPQPYLFEPHDTARHYRAGDTLEFDLLLFGQAVELQAFAVMAIDRMAHRGLGVRRQPFRLEEIRYLAAGGWRTGYRRGAQPWPGRVEPRLPARNGIRGDFVKLRFLSPTRIKIRQRLVREIDFPTLAFRMLRRTLELAHFHVPGAAVDWDQHSLLERAEGVRVVESDFAWRDWRRYSNRQKSQMALGGFVGEMVLEGELEPFVPVLRTAEVIHVGKGTTFGLGRVEVGAI